MSHKRNAYKKKRRSDRLQAGKILAGVVPAVPLETILVEAPASPAASAPVLSAVEQAQMTEALNLYAIFERVIGAPIRNLLFRAAVIRACRGMKEGLAEGTSEKK